jgi:small subunit ribosomal protein S15
MKKTKSEIIESLKINPKDVGSSEVQIGLLTNKINSLSDHFKQNKNDKHSTMGLLSKKINHLSDHFKKNKNDKHSTRGLLKAVNQRKRLLLYLKRKNLDSYTKILEKLNLRK